jgi:transcriptional repressor NrdR
MSCHEAFTTYEAADLGFMHVSSSHALRGPYSRARLYRTIANALEPSKAPATTADALTDTIETKLLDLKSPVITTNQIAGIILSTLKHFDTPAFLRYLASHANLRTKAELARELKNY